MHYANIKRTSYFWTTPKDARQYVQADLADQLREYVAAKAPGARVFNMPDKHDVVPMFLADLADARRAWLTAVRHDLEEYARREQSDFLVKVNHEGEVLDFHSLRPRCSGFLLGRPFSLRLGALARDFLSRRTLGIRKKRS